MSAPLCKFDPQKGARVVYIVYSSCGVLVLLEFRWYSFLRLQQPHSH